MSKTLTERVEAWQRFVENAENSITAIEFGNYEDVIILVGYEHQCGVATMVEKWEGYDGSCCYGCRFIVEHPEEDCTPLYKITWEMWT